MSNRRFERQGQSWPEIERALHEAHARDLVWTDPHNLKASYFAGEDVVRVATDAFNLYMGNNAIYGATLYPSLPELETNVAAKVLEMLNAPEQAGGSVTTGGTESIMMAVKTARDWARTEKPEVRAPELVVPETAHPAFSKAAHLLGLKVVRMSASPGFRADVEAMAAAVNENTIMIVASAPPYPLCVVDPIPAIGEIAERHDLWMHVDGCIGGFVLPFMEDLGVDIPIFDFRVPAVCSMSVDLHKYGYANRGASCLLMRDEALESHQRFTHDEWPGGIYSTLNFAGSRAGGPVASAWAVMGYLGYDGYLERVSGILEAKRRYMAGINAIDGLKVLGEPEGGHFSFGATDDLDMAAVAEGMEARGWHFGRMRRPPAMLVLLNYTHGDIADEFLDDLGHAVADVRAGRITARDEEAVYIS